VTSQQNLNASAENRGIHAQEPNTDASSAPRNPILITIDLEDWFQVERLCPVYPRHTWDVCDLRVKMNTRILLDLLDHYHVRATFFVLGWVAERCPDLVREVHNRGHEIACHGYDHRRCSDMSVRDLREDLYKSKAILSDIVAYPIIGYRAPGFSVTQRLIEILRELNFVYDSSYNSTILNKRHRRLPDDMWHRSSSGHLIYRNGIIELPVSNFKFVGKVLPWGGGEDLRVWPPSVFEWGIRQILKREGRYVFYMHPWEIDLVQPKVKELPFHSRARHYLHLSSALHRVSHLLSTFQTTHVFMSCRQYINA
jgi:polysaccharide deacetylase family protein (PEP-CTERM system associated)